MMLKFQNLPTRLLSIDLLRGMAALAVMFYHAANVGIFAQRGVVGTPRGWTASLVYPVSFGFTGVYLFFVISGFCIHLRWVKREIQRSNDRPLEFGAFWKRRFRRIYPAYIAALLIFTMVAASGGTLQFNSFFVWDFVSHILMLHNLDARTVYTLNGVFWTLAIEEQLYLAYFLLVWLRKRFGWGYTLLVCFCARIAWFGLAFLWYKLFAFGVPVLEASLSNWFVWALGAVSVEAAFGLIRLPRWTTSSLLGLIVLVVTAVLYVLNWSYYSSGWQGNLLQFIIQPLWGIGFFFIVNRIVELEASFDGWVRPIVRVLAWIGLYSYSLYLTHQLAFYFIPDAGWIVKALSALVLAWVFYLIFERPFMNVPPKIHELNAAK